MNPILQLKHIASVNAGYPFRGKIEESSGTGIVAVQMKDVSPVKGVEWTSCTETSLEGKRAPNWLRTGDILFAARGSRNYAVSIDLETARNEGFRSVASPHFYIIRCEKEQILPEFLAWQLNQPPCQRYFDQQSEGSLTKSVRRSVLEETLVAVPSLTAQEAIVGLEKTLRKERELLEQLIRNGDALLSSIALDLTASQRNTQ